ncbi:MAG: transposase [Chloroflexi bacterium]|jgi:putative transposase|nr:transposase [Chloroflexota bacterium]
MSKQPDQPPAKGGYSRGYLPHLDQPGVLQAITFRLADSMPATRRAEWEELIHIRDAAQQRARLQHYLDAGYGACWLVRTPIARLVEEALLRFDGQRYRLLAWVIMPNHVHVLIETLPGHPLDHILHSWKSFTASKANAILGRKGAFWHRDYYDRYIRDERHLERAVLYMHNNPVQAGLVDKPQDWPFGSARLVDSLDATTTTPYVEG